MAIKLTDRTITEQLGGAEKTKARLRRFREASMKMDTMQDELVKRCPDQWVAIFDSEVIGADDDLTVLLDKVRAAGIPTNETVVEYAETDPMETIL